MNCLTRDNKALFIVRFYGSGIGGLLPAQPPAVSAFFPPFVVSYKPASVVRNHLRPEKKGLPVSFRRLAYVEPKLQETFCQF